jgi:hypothetical protein
MALGVRAGAGIAGLALLAGCQLILDFSPIEDGGTGGTQIDSAAADAFDACGVLEENDGLAAAAPIDVGTFRAGICPAGDEDYYGFMLDGTQDLVIVMMFQPGPEDLDLELYDATTTELVRVSIGSQGVDRIEQSLAVGGRLPAGAYAARVFGHEPAVQNEYDLTLTHGGALPPPVDAGAGP